MPATGMVENADAKNPQGSCRVAAISTTATSATIDRGLETVTRRIRAVP